MKTLFQHPLPIYFVAGLGCLCIMIMIDYWLGAEAEHLNAWVVLNYILGQELPVPESLAIRRWGLTGAAVLMILVNAVLGPVLLYLLRGLIQFIHLF